MIYIINNVIDFGWLISAAISILISIIILVPWRFIYEVIMYTILVMIMVIMFMISEGYRAVKRMFRKRRKFIEVDSHELFI